MIAVKRMGITVKLKNGLFNDPEKWTNKLMSKEYIKIAPKID